MFFGVKTMKEKPFSLCIIYFVFLQFYGTSCNWVVTATVRDEVTNAGNHFGLCRFNTTKGADKNEPICAKDGEIGGWVDRGVENGQLEQLANGCEYFRKTRVFLCFEAPAGSGRRAPTCRRNYHYFQMRTSCYNQWLHWSNCSSSESAICEAGLSWRYQFRSSLSFKFQVQPCKPTSCPRWSDWTPSSNGCAPSCTNYFKRSCMVDDKAVDPSRCTNDFTGELGSNNTHILLPCLGDNCPAVREVRFPPISSLTSFSPPPYPVPVPQPKIECANNGLQLEEVEPVSTSVFDTNGFWVGFCVGLVVIVAIFVIGILIYCQTRKGKATIAAIKTYRANEKRYYDRKRRINVQLHTADSTSTSQLRTPLNRSRSERDFDAKTIESTSSCPSWRKDEGYRSHPNTGSLSGTSKYQESLNLSGPSYGPFYTPSGESKLLNPNRRPLPIPIVNDIKRGALSSDSMASDSDSDTSYDPSHPPHWDDSESPTASINLRNGAFYYEKHFNSQGRQRGAFNEDAYMRSYRRYRAQRKQGTTPEKKPPSDRPQSPAESSKAGSLFEKVTRPLELKKNNSALDNEKLESNVAGDLQVELPQDEEEEVTRLSDAETQRWVSDAEKSRPTTIAESVGNQSDTEMPQWSFEVEKPAPSENMEFTNRAADAESHRWMSDAEKSLAISRNGETSDAESHTSSQHWASDVERSRVANEPLSRRLAETERSRWGSHTARYRRASNERPLQASADRSHRTIDRAQRPFEEKPSRTISVERLHRNAEQLRRMSPDRLYRQTGERPRRTSTERGPRGNFERPQRASNERSRWASTERINGMRGKTRRPSTEKSRQTTERPQQTTLRTRQTAERPRYTTERTNHLAEIPRGSSAERGRDFERSQLLQRREEGRPRQENSHDYRYAKLNKRAEPGERPHASDKARNRDPARAATDERHTRRLPLRDDPTSRPPNQGNLDFPPPPPSLLGK